MYAVIFKAELNAVTDDYSSLATRMRGLALEKYGCTEFNSVMEGLQEISISYWKTLEQINNWKQDPEHLMAQELGRTKFYKSYKVEVVEIIREYNA